MDQLLTVSQKFWDAMEHADEADVSGFLTIAGFCKDTMGKLRMAQTRPLWYNHRQRGKESHGKERGTG